MNRFTRMHNDYLDPDRHQPPEPPEWWEQCQRNSRAIFKIYGNGGDTWYSVYRSIYKYTDCGPTVGVLFDGEDQVCYCDSLRQFGKGRVALQIHVSSIVEGVEQCTDTIVVDLTKLRSGRAARKALSDAIKRVDEMANDIWEDTHGCAGCAKLWNNISAEGEEIVGSDGITPCHPNCPTCLGHGVVF